MTSSDHGFVLVFSEQVRAERQQLSTAGGGKNMKAHISAKTLNHLLLLTFPSKKMHLGGCIFH